ncbi:MAG: hypothetical protein K0U12_01840 [Gammaproteobacteria bacterium]|nr:hypothetical protein [Gammaproteobacteria bacterium]
MAKKNSKKKASENGLLRTREAIIAGLISGLVSLSLWVLNHQNYNSKAESSIKVNVLNQFELAKNGLYIDISTCLSAGKISNVSENVRIKRREDLVRYAMDHRKSIKPGTMFNIALLTRFDDTQHLKKLCKLKNKQLTAIQNKLNSLQVSISRTID